MKINYSHLCEKAFLSQNGNLNVIGIFENVAAQQFPISFPQLCVVTSLEGELGDHSQTIRIINRGSGEEVMKPIQVNMNIKPNDQQPDLPPGNLRILGDINNLTIPREGEYEVQILVDGEQAYAIPFKAVKSVRPIPEGR